MSGTVQSVHEEPVTSSLSSQGGLNLANHQNRARAPLGDPNMVTLGKEMTDLLKDQKACVIPLSQLIQAFHKKYGRNPFKAGIHPITTLTKLSHVIQLMGNEGNIIDYHYSYNNYL